MTTQSENEILTRVGRGTPAGELLRRYWHPVAMAGDLTEEAPTRAVTILGEKLVVFRLPPAAGKSQPRYGLVEEQCNHRLASLAYGTVDSEGIRCPYHGWKYDLAGNCVEQPAEPPDSKYKNEIHQQAYPVQKLAGMLFAYLGPLPAPLLPRWDVLVREDGKRWIDVQDVINCNWLQPTENSVDPSHVYWLHGFNNPNSRPRGEYREKHDFIKFRYGIVKRRTTLPKEPGERAWVEEHPLIFPSSLRNLRYNNQDLDATETWKEGLVARHYIEFRVPVDDAHTQVYHVNFTPSETERSPADVDPPYEFHPVRDANGNYYMDRVWVQDVMAWETQGAITDRSREHLGAADRGIVVFRKLLREQIEVVRNGGEPIGVIRDPKENESLDLGVINERYGLMRSETQEVREQAKEEA
ncbi:MAG: Rieske (2Fe-2S) domain protein [Noviherbaspirillum sp.]|nr:Rieske (2Fe-2S) domain protein [Noviherbaspirillum sp.]